MTAGQTQPTVTIGEVVTALLQHSAPMPLDVAASRLVPVPGEPVYTSLRPIEHLRSAVAHTGVDALLPAAGKTKVRGVGSVATRVALLGGVVVQATSFVRVVPAPAQRRLLWDYYVTGDRRGTLETIGKVTDAQVIDGFLTERDRPGTINLGAIGDRSIDELQERGQLDWRPPLRSARVRLRFAIDPAQATPIVFGVNGDEVRRLRLPALAGAAEVISLCEDIAAHDWLLATATEAVRRGSANRRFLESTTPVLDRLAHLWMPGARLRGAFGEVWAGLDAATGMGPQWTTTIQRIRDQLAISAATGREPEPRPVSRGLRRSAGPTAEPPADPSQVGRGEERVVDAIDNLVGGQV